MSADSNTAEPTTDTTEPDDIEVGLIATIAIVGALLVVAIAAALTALVRSESTAYGLETGTYANLGAVRRLKVEQHAKLEGPVAWGDKAKGQVTLPIERAMDMVQKDIQRDPYLATVTPPAATEAPAAGSAAPAATTGAAAPTPKDDKENGKAGKHNAPAGGKVDPPSGAPVTPAAAPK